VFVACGVAHPLAEHTEPGAPQHVLAAPAGRWHFEGGVKSVPAVGSNDSGTVV
jgi:hypothetical protein